MGLRKLTPLDVLADRLSTMRRDLDLILREVNAHRAAERAPYEDRKKTTVLVDPRTRKPFTGGRNGKLSRKARSGA